MNHPSVSPTMSNHDNRQSVMIQHVLPVMNRRDLLVSSSAESASESSLDYEASPIKSYGDNNRPDELRAYTISLARKLRRIKRRLLLENATVLAQGPTVHEPSSPTRSCSNELREAPPTSPSTTSKTRPEMPTLMEDEPPRTPEEIVSPALFKIPHPPIKASRSKEDIDALPNLPMMASVPEMRNQLTSNAA